MMGKMNIYGSLFAVSCVALIHSAVANDQIYSIYDLQERAPQRDCPYRYLADGISFPRPENELYRSGDQVRYACAPNYELRGRPSATCNDGQWSVRLPRCIEKSAPPTTPAPITCSRPVIENGYVQPSRSSYKVGESIVFRCNDGYARKGASISICLADGDWAGKLPECEAKVQKPKVCKRRDLEFGSIEPEKKVYQHREVVIYDCNEGYTLKGTPAAACFNGEWTSELPICEGKPEKKCLRPPRFPHGNVSPLKMAYNDMEVITYNCEKGYDMIGQKVAACFEGKWSADHPECKPPPTEKPIFCFAPVVENGAYTPQRNRYSVGDEIKLRCRGKYFRDGPRKAICQENGEWTALPVCRFGCEEPEISGGYYNTKAVKTGPYFPSGSVIVVNCNSDYTVAGHSEQTCNSNGRWAPGLPECQRLTIISQEVGCEPPTYSFATYAPGLTGGRQVYSVGDAVTFTCKGESHAQGHNFAECLPSGRWSKVPVCSSECRRPWISNGMIDLPGDSFKQNTVIRLSCDDGYLPVGRTSATCRANGAWSANLRCTDGCYAPRAPHLQTYPAPEEGGNVYEFGKRITFRCDAGYASSVPSAECRGKDKWDRPLPKCNLLASSGVSRPFQQSSVGCPYPRLAEGLQLKNQRQALYPFKTQFEFQCAKGFNMIGSAVSICRKHLNGLYGGLDPSPPRCERTKCGSPGKPQNGRFRDGEKSAYYFGDTVYFVCDDKHIMSGNNKLTCQADGQFNGIPPKCQPPSCRVECKLVKGRECQCDAECRFRGDCCYDFEQHCRRLFY